MTTDMPGERSEITQKLALLIAKHVPPSQVDEITRHLFGWADENRGRGIARNRVLAVANLMRTGADRSPLTPQGKGEYALVSLFAEAPASPPGPAAPRTIPKEPAPPPPAVIASPLPVPRSTILSRVYRPSGEVSFAAPAKLASLDVARESMLDEYIRSQEHPFVRYALVNGQPYVFAGSARGLDKERNILNVAFRVGGKNASDFGATSASRELSGGMTYWVWAFPYQEGSVVRFWANVTPIGADRGRDDPNGRAKVVLTSTGYNFVPST